MIAATPRTPPTWPLFLTLLVIASCNLIEAWVTPSPSFVIVGTRGTSTTTTRQPHAPFMVVGRTAALRSSTDEKQQQQQQAEELVYDYETPEDAVIHIQPRAMNRLRELRAQQFKTNNNSNEYLVLRMGVRNGGCSGMSYVMDFAQPDSINAEEDTVDTYENEKIQCVVDSKSLLYLYGLELDYSNELVGGGFRFKNPNAEESCGCGSSFAV